MKSQKTLAFLLTVAISISLLAGCTRSGQLQMSDENPTKESEVGTAQTDIDGTNLGTVAGSYLKFGCTSDPKTFGPWDGGGGGRNMTNISVYEALAYMKSDGTISNCIMESYTNPSEGVYNVKIYDYVHDSEGNPITADDIVFSFTKCAEQGNWATYTAVLDSISKIDEYTVEIKLVSERPDSFSGLLENVMIVSRKAYEGSKDSMAGHPIGTGSYVLENYTAGAEMTYVVNPDYWQTDTSLIANQSLHNVEKYTIKFISDKSQHSIALETGAVDNTNGVLSADYVNFLNDDGSAKDGYAYIESEKQGFLELVFNCGESSVCKDENLRKAIAYAIDRAAMAYAAYGDAGLAYTSFSQTTHFDYDESYTPDGGYFTLDEATARNYLDKSGYKGETLTLYAQNDTEVAIQCELIRSYCEAIGIDVDVNTFDKSLYNDYLYSANPEWDLTVCFGEGGDYTYVSMAWCLDINYFTTGVNCCQIYDAELQTLFDTATNVKTFSVDNTKALQDYVFEHCYMVALSGFTQKVFYNSTTIEQLGTTKTGFDPVPGACVPVV